MNVWLDEQAINVKKPTLAAALDAAREAAQTAGRVIIEAEWDHQRIPDDLLETPPDTLSDKKDLHFTSADPLALVSTTMFEIADVVQHLAARQTETAEALQSGNMPAAFESLGEVVAVWETVRRAVQEGPALVGKSVAELNVKDDHAKAVSLAAMIGGLTDDLTQVRSALASEDWSTLADLLHGEMDCQSRKWFAILKDLGEQMKPTAGA